VTRDVRLWGTFLLAGITHGRSVYAVSATPGCGNTFVRESGTARPALTSHALPRSALAAHGDCSIRQAQGLGATARPAVSVVGGLPAKTTDRDRNPRHLGRYRCLRLGVSADSSSSDIHWTSNTAPRNGLVRRGDSVATSHPLCVTASKRATSTISTPRLGELYSRGVGVPSATTPSILDVARIAASISSHGECLVSDPCSGCDDVSSDPRHEHAMSSVRLCICGGTRRLTAAIALLVVSTSDYRVRDVALCSGRGLCPVVLGAARVRSHPLVFLQALR